MLHCDVTPESSVTPESCDALQENKNTTKTKTVAPSPKNNSSCVFVVSESCYTTGKDRWFCLIQDLNK